MLVPPIVIFLTSSPLIKLKHLENVTSVTSGAAPLSKSDVDKFYNKFKISLEKLKFSQGKKKFVKFS